jgi:hypothetical protein
MEEKGKMIYDHVITLGEVKKSFAVIIGKKVKVSKKDMLASCKQIRGKNCFRRINGHNLCEVCE